MNRKGDKIMCLQLKEEKQFVLFEVQKLEAEECEKNPAYNNCKDTGWWRRQHKVDYVIDIPESNANFVVHNFDLFEKGVTRAYRNKGQDRIFNKPSMKPTGKPIELIIKEMEAEVEAIKRHKIDLKESILEYRDKWIPEAEKKYEHLRDLHWDAHARKRTWVSVFKELGINSRYIFDKLESEASEQLDRFTKALEKSIAQWEDAYPGQSYE